MKATEHRCYTVACDECGRGVESDDGVLHYDSAEEAAKSAVEDCEWERDGERLICSDCAARATCAAEGHDYGPWMLCMCGGKRHATAVETRYCARCSKLERREADGVCGAPHAPVPFSDGALMIQHRRNDAILRDAYKDKAAPPHVVPEHVEALVAEGAAIAERIDLALAAAPSSEGEAP